MCIMWQNVPFGPTYKVAVFFLREVFFFHRSYISLCLECSTLRRNAAPLICHAMPYHLYQTPNASLTSNARSFVANAT